MNPVHVVPPPVVPDSEPLAHERLDAYRVALELFSLALELTGRLPRTKGQLGDQLQRASESVVLRIAEAAGGEWRSADQRRSFRAARGFCPRVRRSARHLPHPPHRFAGAVAGRAHLRRAPHPDAHAPVPRQLAAQAGYPPQASCLRRVVLIFADLASVARRR